MAHQKELAEIPTRILGDLSSPEGTRVFVNWLQQVIVRISDNDQILWKQLNKSGTTLKDLSKREYSDLQNTPDTTTNSEVDSKVEAHAALTVTHGSNGDIVGKSDVATATDKGVVNMGGVVADVSIADAPTQGATYVQADVQAIATLANANKVAINALIASLRNAGVIAT